MVQVRDLKWTADVPISIIRHLLSSTMVMSKTLTNHFSELPASFELMGSTVFHDRFATSVGPWWGEHHLKAGWKGDIPRVQIVCFAIHWRIASILQAY